MQLRYHEEAIKPDYNLAFGVYKMEVTKKNISENGRMQVVIASMEGGPKGFRLTGKASVEGQLVLFKAEQADPLL